MPSLAVLFLSEPWRPCAPRTWRGISGRLCLTPLL